MTSFDQDSSYDKAAMGALSGEKCPACGTNIDRKPGEHWVLLDGGKRVCTNPWHNPKGFDRRKPAVQPCKYGDPFCPCQDGDTCHYEGENPMPTPTSALSGEPEICPECGSRYRDPRRALSTDSPRFYLCEHPWHGAGSTPVTSSADECLPGAYGSTGAEPACKQCAFWHEHGHKSLTKGRWSDCGHPCFLGTDKCEVCANTEPAPDAKELADLLCPPHASLDRNHHLEPFDNCIACIRVERDELRALLLRISTDIGQTIIEDPIKAADGWTLLSTPVLRDIAAVFEMKREPSEPAPVGKELRWHFNLGRLYQFERMKKKRPIDPTFWDDHEFEQFSSRDLAADVLAILKKHAGGR